MTQEQKAKAYDEVRDKIALRFGDNVAKEIFSQFEESEDERIRTAISRILYAQPYRIFTNVGCTEEECLAWLEKQGEHKVEPKFKTGDWIVWRGNCYKVNYNGCGYELIDQNGLSTSLEYGTIDENAHLWDISKDAKDGDVLYHKAENGIEYIVMSKGLNEFNNIDSYFRYSSIDGFDIDVPSVLNAEQDNIHPATKKQRDSLMKAMTDAGYTFDFEKKKLKKIEKKPADKVESNLLTVERANEISPFMGSGFENEPAAWNEEDEKRLESCLNVLQAKGIMGVTDTINTKWLKSLKDRVQPQSKQEWSEEDEKKRTLLIRILEVNHPNGYFKVNPANTLNMEAMPTEELVSWLKSFKPQNRWKPSDK